MSEALRELYRYRSLLVALTYRDIRIKYKQSIMGFMWAILMPLLIVMVGILVRYAYSLASGQAVRWDDVLGVAIRSVPWAFTVSSIRFATSCLVANVNLVTKIYFPKEIFPMASVTSSLFDFLIAAIPLVIIASFAGAEASLQLLWVPVLLVILIVIVTGVSLFMSAASLFFRDVKYLVEIMLTFGIFFTPVFFSVDMFGDYRNIMMLNPLSAVFEGLESTVMRATGPDLVWLGYSAAFGLLALIGGYRFFRRLEPAFAESI